MKACRDYSIADDLAARRLTSSFKPASSMASLDAGNGNGNGAGNGNGSDGGALQVSASSTDGGVKKMDTSQLS